MTRQTEPSVPPVAGDAVALREALDWRYIAKAAGEHGIRYRTNAALIAFFNEMAPLYAAPPQSDGMPHTKAMVRYFHEAADAQDALEEIASASWPSVNGDDPVKRIQAFARKSLSQTPTATGQTAGETDHV